MRLSHQRIHPVRRLRVYLHELLLCAFGADDVLSVGDETLAHERGLALRADEAVVVPVAVFERDETRATDTWKRWIWNC